MSRKDKPENKTGAPATLYVYDEIGSWGVDAQEFVKSVNAIDSDEIHVRIDSIGGDVFAARAMQTALKQHKAKVIAHIDGLAASAASFLIMAADEIEIVEGGFLMLHKALALLDIFGMYNDDHIRELKSDMTETEELLSMVTASIITDYAQKTGKTTEEITGWMVGKKGNGTWFNSKSALEIGLVDRIYGGTPVDNKHDLSIYNNVPDEILGKHKPSKRSVERALRDAGCSQTTAKAILSRGWDEEPQRDAEPPTPEPQPREVVDPYEKLLNKIDSTLKR